MGAAARDLMKQKGLKAQRFSTATATLSFGTIEETHATGEASEHQAE
jgi:hypothetical protein